MTKNWDDDKGDVKEGRCQAWKKEHKRRDDDEGDVTGGNCEAC